MPPPEKNVDDLLLRDADRLIRLALDEDIGTGDVTCQAVIPADARLSARIRVRERAVVSGLWIAERVFLEVDSNIAWSADCTDGDSVESDAVLAQVQGPARGILTAERTALNFLQRLCGIATETRRCVEAVANTSLQVLDTRKTTPGFRRLEKYAVRCGGGGNHRMGLYDRIMMKDNHLAMQGESDPSTDWPALIQACRSSHPGCPVEVEVDRISQFLEVIPMRPDWILLDNMSDEDLKACAEQCPPGVQLEASGGIFRERLPAIAATGVHAVSLGALTHSAPVIDIGLDVEMR